MNSVHLFSIEKSAGWRLVCSSTSCTHAHAHTWLSGTRREQRTYSCDKSFASSGRRDTEDSGHSVKTQIKTFFAASSVYLSALSVYLLIFLLHISFWLVFPKKVELSLAGQFCILLLIQNFTFWTVKEGAHWHGLCQRREEISVPSCSLELHVYTVFIFPWSIDLSSFNSSLYQFYGLFAFSQCSSSSLSFVSPIPPSSPSSSIPPFSVLSCIRGWTVSYSAWGCCCIHVL